MNQLPATLPTPASVISETAFFAGLTPAQVDRVAALGRLSECEAGVHLYHAGEPAQAVYVLVSGSVRFAVGMGERKPRAGDILRRGDLFGWAALTPRCNVRIATASCLTPCTLLVLDGPGLVRLMDGDHTLGYRLMRQLNDLVSGTLTAFAGG